MSNLIADKLELNGLLDRQALQALMEKSAAGARAAGQSMAVLTLDLDHFKAYLDEQGQAQAQAALMRTAKLLNAHLPVGASLAHLGGDEFVMLLPTSDLGAAVDTAETLRGAVEAEFTSPADPAALTVTLGAAASPPGTDWTAHSLLSLADARKTFGKKRLLPHHNRVWAGALPSDWYPRFNVQPEVWPSQ
jgi:diguanylate cyclase (GGDEF)-like protein